MLTLQIIPIVIQKAAPTKIVTNKFIALRFRVDNIKLTPPTITANKSMLCSLNFFMRNFDKIPPQI